MGCYRVEKLRFDRSAFTGVKRSFLITMSDSGRRAQYMEQLRRARPTVEVNIVHNKGFTRCRKQKVCNSIQDLWHVNMHIFDLTRHDPTPVLVMEDDVEFTAAFHRESAGHVESALSSTDVYSLGMMPFFSRRRGRHHLAVSSGGFAHAVIYSKRARDMLLSRKWPTRVPHDVVVYSKFRTMTFHVPLAVQKIQRTANSRSWDKTGALVRAMGTGDHTRMFERWHRSGARGGVFLRWLFTFVTATLVVSVASVFCSQWRRRCRGHAGCRRDPSRALNKIDTMDHDDVDVADGT